jgi:hypothetical protein
LFKWIDSFLRKVCFLISVFEFFKQLIFEEVKKYYANEVAKIIRDFQLESYQFSSISFKDYLKLRRTTKRNRNKYNLMSTARLKRRWISERIRSQNFFSEFHFQPAAESEVQLANQKAHD